MMRFTGSAAVPAFASQSCALIFAIILIAGNVPAQPSATALPQARQDALRIISEAVKAGERGDYATELRLIRPLADQGDWSAQVIVATMYMDGVGVSKDHAEAARLYISAAQGGNPVAAFLLAQMYQHGDGVPLNNSAAIHWLEEASSSSIANIRGMAKAQLGLMYYKGIGVAVDYDRAFTLLTQSAAVGNADGEAELGDCYFLGRGTERNYSEAAKWYQSSAEQGHILAQAMIGSMYWKGYFYPTDLIAAYRWTDTALSRATDPSIKEPIEKNLRAIANSMSSEQLADAQRMGPIWKPTVASDQGH